ncbi:hypothetical protein Dxin01_02045 [Deinococcus xinjiangensis]|uniref:Uncharacterized protein n=1 Tax=Deinococcus xinjiangensis TaxID=457454 RepID=A0ABP9VC39_9DEIO
MLSDLSGSKFFPDGLREMTLEPSFLKIDHPAGAQAVKIEWATYFDAADQSGQSRIWGGIHIEPDDLAGRRVGHEVGVAAAALAHRYFDGLGK